MHAQMCKQWLYGNRANRNLPKPIGAFHRAGCTLMPCAPIIAKRPFALELVVRAAPNDTIAGGGNKWAAWALRNPARARTPAEEAILKEYPEPTAAENAMAVYTGMYTGTSAEGTSQLNTVDK